MRSRGEYMKNILLFACIKHAGHVVLLLAKLGYIQKRTKNSNNKFDFNHELNNNNSYAARNAVHRKMCHLTCCGDFSDTKIKTHAHTHMIIIFYYRANIVCTPLLHSSPSMIASILF